MPLTMQIRGDLEIQFGGIRSGPPYAAHLIAALGLVYMNWGRLEQSLEFLLQFTNDARLVTGEITRFPDTSFRLKTELFKRIYARHPNFVAIHHLARPMVKAFAKANKQRVRMVHSNFQRFQDGPPPAMEVTVVKFEGADLMTHHGTWTFQALQAFGEHLCQLNDDLAKIIEIVIAPAFLKSLERPLSRTQRASLWVRRNLRRLWIRRRRRS